MYKDCINLNDFSRSRIFFLCGYLKYNRLEVVQNLPKTYFSQKKVMLSDNELK